MLTGTQMTPKQYEVLSHADETGQLRYLDHRAIPRLERNGWVEKRVKERGRRRPLVTWHLTEAGAVALAAAVVVEPRPRPAWRASWDRERVETFRYRVEGHELWRPGKWMLWRVVCPALGEEDPVAYGETLGEVVELLDEHLRRVLRGGRCGPRAVDLDALT